MTPDEIPQQLVDILDERAGKVHSRTGPVLSALAEILTAYGTELLREGVHHYLSTGCLHGEHSYCQCMTGMQGTKRPGRCKFCEAKCLCVCHNTNELNSNTTT